MLVVEVWVCASVGLCSSLSFFLCLCLSHFLLVALSFYFKPNPAVSDASPQSPVSIRFGPSGRD